MTGRLRALADAGTPIRIGLIGAGKFGRMFLAQIPHVAGFELVGICDRELDRCRAALDETGSPRDGGPTPLLSDDAGRLLDQCELDVVVEATGDPSAALRHALDAIDRGIHVVNVTVEADALLGPLLARRATEAGCVYSMAYGDQPALICEMVEWARTVGFHVVCAGKGTRYLPIYHESTPETVWGHYGMTPAAARRAGMNAKMFNSFLDGTKSAIEMAAVANACDLTPPAAGLGFPPASRDQLAEVLIPTAAGGVLTEAGTVEVISSLHRDGSDVPGDLRWGVYVTFEASNDYAAECLPQYGVATDASGRYAAMYRPSHLIGLELGVSVASAATRGEPTGQPRTFAADVVAVAKRDMKAGERLDGEGGATVWGQLMPAAASLAAGHLPIGLCADLPVADDVAVGQRLCWQDVELPESEAVTLRRELEASVAVGAADAVPAPRVDSQ